MSESKTKPACVANGVPAVGYRRPPVHKQFKPGHSGNPSGRAKGSKNLKTLFNKILNEEVSLREGSDVRKVTKAEAVIRSLVIGALKGDSRSIGTLFRLAEQTGQFDEPGDRVTEIRRIIVDWKDAAPEEGAVVIHTGVPRHDSEVPGISEICKDPK